MGSGEFDEPPSRTGEFGPEAVGHPGPKLLAVAQPVVLEGDALVVGEQPQMVGDPVGGLLDERVAAAHVPLVPDGGGEGVGVAEEHRRPGARGRLLLGVLGRGDEREVVGGEGDVLPLGPGPPGAQPGQFPFAELPPVLGDVAGLRPDAAAPPVVVGEGAGHRRGAGGFRAENDDPAGERGPYGWFEEVPAAHGVLADGGAGDREDRAVGVDADGFGAEPAGQFVPVRLRCEDGVHRSGHGPGEDGHVRVPDRRVVQVHADVVDSAHDRCLRVHLPHPGHPVGERYGLDGGGTDQDGQPLAAVLRGADEVVVTGVRRIELAEDEPVREALHAATSTGRCRCTARSRCQLRRPIRHSVRKPTYSREVR